MDLFAMTVFTNTYGNRRDQRGFIALITTTPISFMLLMSTLALSQQSLLGRFSLMHTSFKEKSRAEAHGCITLVQVALHTNPLLTITDKKILFNSEKCSVSIHADTPVTHSSEILITTTVHGSVTTLRALFDTKNQKYTSIEEVPNQ